MKTVIHVAGVLLLALAGGAQTYIRKLEEKLQRQIMKCLDYRTPKEILTTYRERKKKQ